MTRDFQQCGILTSLDSEEPVQPHRIFKRLAKALIRLRVCTGWSEPLLVAHTTLLEISCHGSIIKIKWNATDQQYKNENKSMSRVNSPILQSMIRFKNNNIYPKYLEVKAPSPS